MSAGLKVLVASSLKELEYHLLAAPCQRCGAGPRRLVTAPATDQPGRVLDSLVQCSRCEGVDAIRFRYEWALDDETISPAPRPSRLVDLTQWLALASLMQEQADRGTKPPAAQRLSAVRAALCLAEALKFYRDDELPPPGAFFSPESRQVFHEHPERFARQRLRDILARLPVQPQHVPASASASLDDPAPAADRPWWRLW